MIKLTGISLSRSGIAATASALVTIVLTGSLLADDAAAKQSFSKRPYIVGGVGLTHIEPESSTDALTVSENSDVGGHIGFGYDISRMLTLEAYAADLGTADIDFLGAPAGTVDYQVFGISALAYLVNSRSGLVFGDDDSDGLFRREGMSLYGRVGVGHMRNDSDRVDYNRDHPSHAAFGLGVEYGFDNGLGVRAELMSLDTDAKYLNVSLLKRFGDVPAAAAAPAVLAKAAPIAVVPEAPAEPTPVVPPYIYFSFDQSDLLPEAQEKLDAFASALQRENKDLIVEGHTDWIAQEQYNMSLSVRRAEAVANYLVSKGLSRENITTVGYGETRPISNNNTANGRALNRRAEIQVQ